MEPEVILDEKDEPPSKFQEVSSFIEVPVDRTTIPTDSTIAFTKTSRQNVSPSLNSSLSFYRKKPSKPAVKQFTTGTKAEAFRKEFYPEITDIQWNNWQWQLQNRIKDLAGLTRILNLSESEHDAIASHKGPLPSSVTPYYASLMDRNNPFQPVRRTIIKVNDENKLAPGEADDPLHEDADSPVPGLVHRYPDRVLFLVTGFCSVYCRYCTRSRMVGNQGGEYRFSLNQWEGALEYIRQHTEVRDVLLSGGDPLTLSDEKLEWLLSRLRAIPHVEFIRIGTKVPAVLPQRITPGLLKVIKKYHPVWMSIHFTHPDELTPEVAEACSRLANAGIPLGSQTVLLKGINDNVETMKTLFQGLLKIRVKPYYLYQCDPVAGTSHFRTSVDKGLEIIAGLRGFTTGYAVPHYVIDAPGGGGKIPILPNSVVGHEDENLLLKNFEGNIYKYPDPVI